MRMYAILCMCTHKILYVFLYTTDLIRIPGGHKALVVRPHQGYPLQGVVGAPSGPTLTRGCRRHHPAQQVPRRAGLSDADGGSVATPHVSYRGGKARGGTGANRSAGREGWQPHLDNQRGGERDDHATTTHTYEGAVCMAPGVCSGYGKLSTAVRAPPLPTQRPGVYHPP